MADTVRDTINAVLQRSNAQHALRPYQSLVDDVVAALETRDGHIADALCEKGAEMGADEATLGVLMVEVGLRPEPSDIMTTSSGGSEEAPPWAQALIRRVDALAQVARDRLGVRI
jgi:hypothetical protein